MTEILGGKTYTEQEYFDLEIADPLTKYEFVNGNIYAMSGGTINHGRIARNLIRRLANALEVIESTCEVFGSDVKVSPNKRRNYFYPDIFVLCDKIDNENGKDQAVSNPTLIVEVLSQSTESYDRGNKFEKYRSIESLKEYVLVNQEKATVETYVRKNDNLWEYRSFVGLENTVTFHSLEISVPMMEIYENVIFPDPENDKS